METDPQTTGAVHYKRLVDRDHEKESYRDARAKDAQLLDCRWEKYVKLSDEYAENDDNH